MTNEFNNLNEEFIKNFNNYVIEERHISSNFEIRNLMIKLCNEALEGSNVSPSALAEKLFGDDRDLDLFGDLEHYIIESINGPVDDVFPNIDFLDAEQKQMIRVIQFFNVMDEIALNDLENYNEFVKVFSDQLLSEVLDYDVNLSDFNLSEIDINEITDYFNDLEYHSKHSGLGELSFNEAQSEFIKERYEDLSKYYDNPLKELLEKLCHEDFFPTPDETNAFFGNIVSLELSKLDNYNLKSIFNCELDKLNSFDLLNKNSLHNFIEGVYGDNLNDLVSDLNTSNDYDLKDKLEQEKKALSSVEISDKPKIKR